MVSNSASAFSKGRSGTSPFTAALLAASLTASVMLRSDEIAPLREDAVAWRGLRGNMVGAQLEGETQKRDAIEDQIDRQEQAKHIPTIGGPTGEDDHPQEEGDEARKYGDPPGSFLSHLRGDVDAHQPGNAQPRAVDQHAGDGRGD